MATDRTSSRDIPRPLTCQLTATLEVVEGIADLMINPGHVVNVSSRVSPKPLKNTPSRDAFCYVEPEQSCRDLADRIKRLYYRPLQSNVPSAKSGIE
jgi:hypothetical protein